MTEDTLKKITDWLESEEQKVSEGALLLLQLNKNQILYRNIIHKNMIDKLRYELNKHRELWEARLNHGEYQQLSKKDKKQLNDNKESALQSLEAQDNKETQKGQREDHALLAEEVLQAYERNAEIYPRMRATHEKLKLMSTDEFTDCDRYPFVKQLGELDAELRANWKLYDNAVAGEPTKNPTAENTEKVVTENNREPMPANKVSSARGYLSGNKANLQKLKEAGNEKGYNVLKEKMQERLTALLLDGQGVDDQHLKELLDLGLVKPE